MCMDAFSLPLAGVKISFVYTNNCKTGPQETGISPGISCWKKEQPEACVSQRRV